ncbi:RHS repeat domain-containing protein [Actinoplanes sp. NPDC049265]|uniref:RHS repeat domain-containing protein n=1 Tax=Actinoplanes sp. NPDC049265 TaxID=3363902 RepID=UPI00371155DF
MSARPFHHARIRLLLQIAAIVALLAPMAWIPDPVLAAPSARADRPVPVSSLKAHRAPARHLPRWHRGGTAWPSGGTAVVDVGPGAGAARVAPRAGTKGAARIGGLPLSLRPPAATPRTGHPAEPRPAAPPARPSAAPPAAPAAPSSVRVSVAGHDLTAKAGVDGVLFTAVRADDAHGPARIAADIGYAGFADAYGADFGGRLRLVKLPACALTTPSRAECRTQTPVPGAVNVRTADVVSTDVLEVSDAAAYALASGPSSDAGTYTATSLSPTYAWAAGDQGGEFTYNVPLRVPPSLGGPAPDLAMRYSSGSVDGRTTSTNNQTSWAGEGWDLQNDFVERSFERCGDDGSTANPGDLCWYTQSNATMVLGGHSTRLVKDDATGRWRGEADDGSRVELLTDGASWRGNGDTTGEYWKVTKVDGTQYFFGLNRRYEGDPQHTDSTQNVLVYGNNPGEPCYDRSSSASGRGCTWTYRWNLDYVVDPRGNSMTYSYEAYVGKYGNWNATQNYAYDITTHLAKIEYGTRAGSEGAQTAPMRVMFGVANRCSDFDGKCEVFPDTPWDLVCGVDWNTQCVQTSPTFWTPWRLSAVVTQILDPATGGYRDVDGWHLTPEYPDPLNGDSPSLWLTHLEHDGDGLAEPFMDFNGVRLANHVLGAPGTELNHFRLDEVVNGTGGVTDVDYSPEQCTSDIVDTISKNNNPYRCFPDGATTMWFHKYVVDAVTEHDLTGGGPDERTTYDYSTDAANSDALWHFDAAEQVPLARRTWNDFAGYSDVTVEHGPADGLRSRSHQLYHRGMNGDYLGAGQGTRFAFVTDSTGVNALDQFPLRGFRREEQTLDEQNDVVAKTVHQPTLNLDPDTVDGGTAHRTASWPGGTMTAFMLREYRTDTFTKIEANDSWRQTRTDRGFDDNGLVDLETDQNDVAVAGDDTCTSTSYAHNDATGMVDRAAQVLTTDCADDATGAHVLAGTQTLYDGSATVGAPPVEGLPTRVNTLADAAGSALTWAQSSRSEYDAYGRVTGAYDALNRKTSTIYRPATGGPLTRTTVINPAGHGTTTTVDARWGRPAQVVDANGRRTRMEYDPLGRLTTVYKPHNAASGAATGYTVTAGSTPYVAGDTAVPLTGDDEHTQITLPFTFDYYGTGYTSAWLSTNGLLSFTDHVADGGSTPIPSTGGPNNALYAFWDDLNMTSSSTVKTKTVGSAPNRQFVIDYHDVGFWDKAGTVSFSITLAETSGVITFNYTGIDRASSLERGDGATIGVENKTGTAGEVYLDDDPILADDTAVTFTPVTAPQTTVPDVAYEYTLRADGPSVVSTRTLAANGNQVRSFALYDGRQRLRQTQSLAPQVQSPQPSDRGRIINDTAYDGRGLTRSTSTFWAAGAPAATLAAFSDAAVPNQHRFAYDGQERETSDALYAGGAARYQTVTGYDGDRTWTVPPAGGTATLSLLNAAGQVTQLRQYLTGTPPAAGTYQHTDNTYDRLGRLTATTDPAGNQSTTTYDRRGRVTATSDPSAGAQHLTYDDAGQLTTSTDGRGVSLSYAYDGLGRRTAVHDGTGTGGFKRAGWVYDTVAKGQLTSSTRFVSGTESYTTAYTGYTDQYQPLGVSVTLPAIAGQPSGTYTVGHTYRPDGSEATTTYPAAGGLAAETVTTTYDDTGRPLTLAGTDTVVASTAYHGYGAVKERVLGAGTGQVRQTTLFDEATGRLTRATTDTRDQATWNTRLDRSFAYDNAGNLTTAGEASASNECFRYDALRRLTQAWTTTAACAANPAPAAVGGPDAYWSSYTWTSTGDRATEVDHAATGDTTHTYTYPAAGARHSVSTVTATGASTGTDGYTYDTAGNVTGRTRSGSAALTFAWDSEEHLASTGGGTATQYRYDADGNRLIARDPAGATAYLPGFELRTTTSGTTCTRYYGTAAVRSTGGGLSFLSRDPNGTAELAVSATDRSVTRRRLDPFGNPRGTDPAWPDQHGFVDGPRDATGLTHLGAREYEPGTGRFISPDPVPHPDDPQQADGYTYAAGNPATFTDPTGTTTCRGPQECAGDPCNGHACPADPVKKLVHKDPSQAYRKPAPKKAMGKRTPIVKGIRPYSPPPRTGLRHRAPASGQDQLACALRLQFGSDCKPAMANRGAGEDAGTYTLGVCTYGGVAAYVGVSGSLCVGADSDMHIGAWAVAGVSEGAQFGTSQGDAMYVSDGSVRDQGGPFQTETLSIGQLMFEKATGSSDHGPVHSYMVGYASEGASFGYAGGTSYTWVWAWP